MTTLNVTMEIVKHAISCLIPIEINEHVYFRKNTSKCFSFSSRETSLNRPSEKMKALSQEPISAI